MKQWHFAHASRSVYEQTDKECEYSFFVSVRLMARQVIGSKLEIKLPKYEGKASLFLQETGNHLTEKFIVTKEKRVIIDNIEIEKEFCGVAVDVYGKIGGYPFVLYFTHPGRVIPVELESMEAEKCGIVEVSLSDTYPLFINDKSSEGSYLEKLRRFLAEDTRSKNWVFHPRYRPVQQRAEQALAARREALLQHQKEKLSPKLNTEPDSRPQSGEIARSEDNRRKVKFQCLMCGTTWIGAEPGYNPCPNCKTHLFGKRLGYADNGT